MRVGLNGNSHDGQQIFQTPKCYCSYAANSDIQHLIDLLSNKSPPHITSNLQPLHKAKESLTHGGVHFTQPLPPHCHHRWGWSFGVGGWGWGWC